MQIGKLARQGGVTVQTLRFYERTGLMPRPARSASGYREYDDQHLRRLRFIRQAKALGFSLAEICKILRMREQGQLPCDEVVSFVERRLAHVDQEIARLQRFREELQRALGDWKCHRPEKAPADVLCILIERAAPEPDRCGRSQEKEKGEK